MSKYPIKKEFFPYNHIKFRLNRRTIALAQKYMKVPRFFWNDPEVITEKHLFQSYDGAEVELYLLTPRRVAGATPCLMLNHGGGFVLEAAPYHYRLALEYAKRVGCKVVFVRYRLAPEYPFPTQFEDCFAGLSWVLEHAEELGIDRERIGVGGDSAGGTLSASMCLMARDRGLPVKLRFQMLIYPYLDRRKNSASYKRFTDTPMWNATLSAAVNPLFLPDDTVENIVYASPVQAEGLGEMPEAYIETAEFDSIHDDGILYARLLRESGVTVELHETEGTMHGFDIALNAPTTRAMVKQRIDFTRRMFE